MLVFWPAELAQQALHSPKKNARFDTEAVCIEAGAFINYRIERLFMGRL